MWNYKSEIFGLSDDDLETEKRRTRSAIDKAVLIVGVGSV